MSGKVPEMVLELRFSDFQLRVLKPLWASASQSCMRQFTWRRALESLLLASTRRVPETQMSGLGHGLGSAGSKVDMSFSLTVTVNAAAHEPLPPAIPDPTGWTGSNKARFQKARAPLKWRLSLSL